MGKEREENENDAAQFWNKMSHEDLSKRTLFMVTSRVSRSRETLCLAVVERKSNCLEWCGEADLLLCS